MDQLALLRMFVAEFDMTLVDQDSRSASLPSPS